MKKILYGISIVIVVLLIQLGYDKIIPEKSVSASVEAENGIKKAFEKHSIHEADCDIEGYYYIGTRYYGESGSIEILDRIAGSLGINSEYYYQKSKTDTGYEATLKKQGKNSELIVKLITTEEAVSENVISQKNYVSINLHLSNSIESGYYYKNLIQKSMKAIVSEEIEASGLDENSSKEDKNQQIVADNIYMVIKGKIYGNVDLDKKKAVSKDISKELNADKVFDSGRDDYSYYAYSNLIEEYVAIGREKINVNVAFSYNEEENTTYVYVGSPIVNYDY